MGPVQHTTPNNSFSRILNHIFASILEPGKELNPPAQGIFCSLHDDSPEIARNTYWMTRVSTISLRSPFQYFILLIDSKEPLADIQPKTIFFILSQFLGVHGEQLMSTSLLKFFKYMKSLNAIHPSFYSLQHIIVLAAKLCTVAVLFLNLHLCFCASVYKSSTLNFLYWISYFIFSFIKVTTNDFSFTSSY